MKWPFPTLFPKMPPHRDPRDWRASIALTFSILGSIAMTFFSMVLVMIMWKGGWTLDTAVARIHVLGEALMLSLTGSLVVLTTLGLAINRRSIRVGMTGFEASGGDDADEIPVAETIPPMPLPSDTKQPAPAPAPAPAPVVKPKS